MQGSIHSAMYTLDIGAWPSYNPTHVSYYIIADYVIPKFPGLCNIAQLQLLTIDFFTNITVSY